MALTPTALSSRSGVHRRRSPTFRARFEAMAGPLRRHPHLLALGLLALVVGAVYWSVLAGDRSLVTNGPFPPGPLFIGDPSAGGAITLPFEHLESTAWAHLQLPVVDPYQGYGIPLLADQGVPVYPLQLLAHFAFAHNYSVWIVVNLLALAFGSYLLASAFGLRFAGAMAVGTAAAFAGVAPPNLNMGMLNPLAVLPFVLVAIRYIVDPHSGFRRSAWLGAVTSVALLCLSGFQEVLPLFAAVILLYTLGMIVHFRTYRLRPGLVVSAGLAGVTGAVIGLVGLLPSLTIVRGHSSLNAPGAYLLHAPTYWLSTLTVPGIAGPGLAAEPQQLGQTVWTLGTPVLVSVVVLAAAMTIRKQGRRMGWYVWPSVALVVYGVLGYANVLHVLVLFDVPVLNSILTIRLLQFAWWIPWCLLLGAVISNVRLLRWFDAVVALVATGLVDLVLVAKFRHVLEAHHLAQYLDVTRSATIVAAVIAVVFLGIVAVARLVGPALAGAGMAALVLGTCLSYLPTNFFPASGSTVPSTVRLPATQWATGNHLAYFNAGLNPVTLPTTTYSAQVWGPIIPQPYQVMLLSLFTEAQTGGYGPLFDGVPTFAAATVDTRLVSLLRSLGVDRLVTTTPVDPSAFGEVAACTGPALSNGRQGLCSLGRATYAGGPPAPPLFGYAVLGAFPLVASNARPVAVASSGAGLSDFASALSPTATALPDEAYVTTSARRLTPAGGVQGESRTATTQSVTMVLSARTPGLAVLRETFSAGMRATVNGHSEPVLAVDGGLWSAVRVGAGRSRVVLDYASLAEEVEFVVAAVGLALVVLAWAALATMTARNRIRTRPQSQESG